MPSKRIDRLLILCLVTAALTLVFVWNPPVESLESSKGTLEIPASWGSVPPTFSKAGMAGKRKEAQRLFSQGKKSETIVWQAKKRLPEDPERRKKVTTEIGYLQKNKARMRYADFRRQGLFVGSGVVEASCKTIIAQRLKQSGMEWSVRGANAIITLRCTSQSGRFEDNWEARVG